MQRKPPATPEPTSLKKLADYLGVSPATVSVVLRDVPGRTIPQTTRDRIKAAAKKFNYRPSLLARSLRCKQTSTIGVLVPELGDGYHTQMMSGIGNQLMNAGYFYFTAHHRHRKDLIEEYSQMLLGRGAEALIAIDSALEHPFPVPAVAVAGHRPIEGVTNIVLNHRRAAELTLSHLYSLGHRNIAFMRGQTFSSDSDDRWRYLVQVAREIGIAVKSDLIVQLNLDSQSPELGYPVVQHLLCNKKKFTALVSFNDIAAIGAVRAFRDFGLRVPEDISVIGFDDINAAAFSTPRLTTIRQPLAEMGRLAAQSVLNRIRGLEKFQVEIVVEPELVVRESTSAAKRKPLSSESSLISTHTAN
ncbi:MAG TPA: LacI family DNA-binding transcriptional regulator [Terriglobales bacterium]|jgi:DNA-binding LacI/PurR family transcriptional regulator|nr:LacI family DNA-binding transcriptional regulator [Terriglobales bacterium]